jgi:hypothetical protein
MTNDDRSNDDRPRYGERITPDSTPQYGEQQHQYGQQQGQQYGQQQGDQYGQQQGQQSDAPSWGGQQHQPQQYQQQQYGTAPASSGGPAWQQHHEPVAKKKTVGRVAAVLAVSALVIGVITGLLFGTAIAQSDAFRQILENGGRTSADPSQFSGLEDDPNIAAAGLMFLFGTLVGLWAIVQGIVAIATKRGRGAGVFAVIVAVVAVIAVFVTYGAVAAVAVSNGS